MTKYERIDQRVRDEERTKAMQAAQRKANDTGKGVAVIYGPRGYYLTDIHQGSLARLRVFPA
jgi:hypothetical protein